MEEVGEQGGRRRTRDGVEETDVVGSSGGEDKEMGKWKAEWDRQGQ